MVEKLRVDCPFPRVFEDVEDKTAIMPNYRRKLLHIRADNDGYRWWSTVWYSHRELYGEAIWREVESVYEELISSEEFRTLESLRNFCEGMPEARVGDEGSEEYNFYLIGELCFYWIRLNMIKGDYNMYLHVFVKEVPEQ